MTAVNTGVLDPEEKKNYVFVSVLILRGSAPPVVWEKYDAFTLKSPHIALYVFASVVKEVPPHEANAAILKAVKLDPNDDTVFSSREEVFSNEMLHSTSSEACASILASGQWRGSIPKSRTYDGFEDSSTAIPDDEDTNKLSRQSFFELRPLSDRKVRALAPPSRCCPLI